MLRERRGAPPLPPSRRTQALVPGRDAGGPPPQPATRWQHHANRRFRPLADEEANRLLGIRADDDDDDEGEDADSELENWRQNAQMLSERDELLLLTGGRGRDALDVAPVNRRKLVDGGSGQRRRSPQTPTTIESVSASSRQSPEAAAADEQTKVRRTIFSLAKRSQESGKQKEKSRNRLKARHKFGRLLNEDEAERDDAAQGNEADEFHEENRADEENHDNEGDDNSSISFAQSGCHSILSAWRLKAAKRRARQLVSAKGTGASSARPRSVLSNSSSVGKKSSASTAYTLGSRLGQPNAGRIPLGPKSAQHFVTNSRRRRRANELILNTLEARRRAISLNRQNILAAGSLFGSESFLDAATPLDDYQRLSLSPSPGAKLRRSPYEDAGQSAAVAELTRRTALSDLGGAGAGRQSPAAEAQRTKLLLMSAARTAATGNNKQRQSPRLSEKGAQRAPPPPLAKLDQNSSDLCSSNESSSGAESKAESSSSSGSRFTQLVTSELMPSRMLMGDELDDQLEAADYRKSRFVSSGVRARSPQQVRPTSLRQPSGRETAQRKHHHYQQQQQATLITGERRPPPPPQQVAANRFAPPDSKTNKENLRQSQQVKQQQVSTTASEDDDKLGKLRRGALKRDSIRRLRLNQKQRSEGQTGDGSSSSNDYDQRQVSRSRPGSSRLASSRDQKQDGLKQQLQQQQQQQQQQQILRPLSKARKLDIESNPFLNRHHFRTMSARSTESRQSYAASQRSRASPVGAARQIDVEPPARRSPALSPPPPPLPCKSQTSGIQDASRLEMPQIDLENLRQAERLIKDLQETRSPPTVTRRHNAERLALERQAKSLSLESASAAGAQSGPPPALPRRHARDHRPQPEDSTSAERNVFRTTTRLVHEGARSSDNLKSDLRGSSQQVELLEKWRHEQQPPVRRVDGSTFSEQKFSSERIEVRRSRERLDGSRPRSISPPAEFSDNPDSRTFTRQQTADDRHHHSNRFSLPAQPEASPRPRQATKTSEMGTKSIAARHSSHVPERPKATATSTTEEPLRRPLETPATRSLPQFERTADDEFRKRVDQLRQMARANLEASEARQRQEAAAARRRELIKPLSTNWDGPKDEENQEAARSLQQAEAIPRRLLSSLRPAPASTNLDEMLLADRYQRPLATKPAAPVGAWRRSNSSLASLGSSARATSAGPARRPLSPSAGTSLLSQQSGSSQIGAPVRVVVRERSAPQLDFAQVEQRPVAQRTGFVEQPASARPSSQPPVAASPGLRLASKSTSQQPRQPAAELKPRAQQPSGPGTTKSQPQARVSSTSGGPSARSPPAMTSTTTPTTATAPTLTSPMRAAQHRASPRSPEFGRAATSSNDDSAIASSVSSPSSFSFPLSAGAPSASQRPVPGLMVPPLPNTGLELGTPETVAGRGELAPAIQPQNQLIQSILRRQQASSGPQAAGAPSAHHHQLGAFPTQAHGSQAPQTQQILAERQIGSPAPLLGLASSGAELQGSSAAPIKRVHFNDRTSVRSFESISSSNSNATAIAHHQQSDLDEFGARQQVGSPDSMGSGSTSRLSCESPAFGESRRPGGAAAIYAVRGDPDLELAGGGAQSPGLSLQAGRIQQALYGPQSSGRQQQQQQQLSGSLQPLLQGAAQTRVQFAPKIAHLQHQVPVPGAIRMTAPPAISTGQPASSRQQQVHPMPVQAHNQQLRAQQLRMPPMTVLVDEEDPDYALRLRQAATRRAAFTFGQQPSPQHAQPVAAAAGQLVAGGGGGEQNSEARSRQHAANLANFHTEV